MLIDNTAPTLTGTEILWATLSGEGVTTVFGYPGGAILPVYDALRKLPPFTMSSSGMSTVPLTWPTATPATPASSATPGNSTSISRR